VSADRQGSPRLIGTDAMSKQPREVRAVRIAAVLYLRAVPVGALADLHPHDVAHRYIRSILSEQPLHGEASMSFAPPAADFNHPSPCSPLRCHICPSMLIDGPAEPPPQTNPNPSKNPKSYQPPLLGNACARTFLKESASAGTFLKSSATREKGTNPHKRPGA
jgi:hypothetical protein